MNNKYRRDLARTKQRILKAALAEFCAKGPAGARTDAIARRARVNKRMLFYCFGSKARLYREVLRLKLSERAVVWETTPRDFSQALLHWYEAACGDPQWIRLQTWEALDDGQGNLAAQNERRALLERALAMFDRWVQQGVLPGAVDLRQLLLSVVALAVFPLAFPQVARLAAGMPPGSPEFRRARCEFLAWLGERIANSNDFAGARDGSSAASLPRAAKLPRSNRDE